MSQLDAYNQSINVFTVLPKRSLDTPFLAQVPLTPECLEIFKSKSSSLDYQMKTATIGRLLIPIDQLKQHPKQRELDTGHARNICDSFEGNPATFMTKSPGIAFLDNPQGFPVAPMADKSRIYRLVDRCWTFTVVAGQHRVEALNLFAQQQNVHPSNMHWVFDILHPFFRGDGAFIQRLILQDNLTFHSAATPVYHELSLLVDTFHSEYSSPNPGLVDHDLTHIDSLRSVHLVKKAMVGGDLNSRHVLSRILTCPHIVEALYTTRFGLSPCSTPSQDSRFYAEGRRYKIWWEQPQHFLCILYLLNRLKLGPMAAAIIYSNAEILKRINDELGIDLQTTHFTEKPARVDQHDIQKIIKEVAISWNAPLLLLHPGLAQQTPSFLRLFENYKNAMHALNVICLGKGQHDTSNYLKKHEELDHPQQLIHNLFDSLSAEKTILDRKRINGNILRVLNAGLSERLANGFKKQVRDPLNKGQTPQVGPTFHGIKPASVKESRLYALITSLVTNNREWHSLIGATEAVQNSGYLFGLLRDDYTMPRTPSSPPNTDLSQKRAEQVERLSNAAADAQTKIASIQSRTDAQVSNLDAKKKRLEVDAQALLVTQRQVILREKELESELSALRDQKQTTKNKVGKTQLSMYTLDSERAAVIASVPADIAPLQQEIQQAQRQKERLQSLPYVSPSGASGEDAHSPPQDECVTLPDPDAIIFGPELVRTLLNTDGLKEFNIQIGPLINLVDAYLSLPAPVKNSFSDPDTCAAFSRSTAAHFHSAGKKRPQRPEDSDDETESLLMPTPRKKARTSFSETPGAGCMMPGLTPEFNVVLQSISPDPDPNHYFHLTSTTSTPYPSNFDEYVNYGDPSAWGESILPPSLEPLSPGLYFSENPSRFYQS